MSLADALKGATLKKPQEEGKPSGPQGLMEEMAAKLARRRKAAETVEQTGPKKEEGTTQQEDGEIQAKDLFKKPWDKGATLPRVKGAGDEAELERLKQELLQEVRRELQKVKEEIIQAFVTELQKRSLP